MENQFWKEINEVVTTTREHRIKSSEELMKRASKDDIKLNREIYGFKVDEKEDGTIKKRARLERLRQNMKREVATAEKFCKAGLQPISVLPTKLFRKLCEEAGLIRLESIDRNGKTDAETIGILKLAQEKAGKRSRALFKKIMYLTGATLFIAVIITTIVAEKVLWLLAIAFPILMVLIAFFTWAIIVDDNKWLDFPKQTKDVKEVITELSARDFVKALWPYGNDQYFPSEDQSVLSFAEQFIKVKVKFPKAPISFIKLLNKMRETGVQPMIAVVPEAISVTAEEFERALQRYNDPIVYNTKRQITAVFSQFGDFPKEKEAMNWVKKKGFRLCLN